MAITPNTPADFQPTITPSDIQPTMGNYNSPKSFRFWCQKVLPAVYDDSLSYYELLCKVVDYLNKTMEDVNTVVDDMTETNNNFTQLQTYVNTEIAVLNNTYKLLEDYVNYYFSNLDVQTEINNKLDKMASDGTLDSLLLPYFNAYTEEINAALANEITARGNADNLLQTQIDNIIAPTGEAPSAAEVENARISYDGEVYNSVGNAIRNEDEKLAKNLLYYNSYNIIPFSNNSLSMNGITFTPQSDGSYLITGTATATAYYNLFLSENSLPIGVVVGGRYVPSYEVSADNYVNLQVWHYTSQGLANTSIYSQNKTNNTTSFTIPNDAVGLLIRLRVPNGTTLPSNGIVCKASLMSSKTNNELEEIINANYEETGTALTNIIITSNDATNIYSNLLTNLLGNTFSWIAKSWFTDCPSVALDTFGWIITLSIDNHIIPTQSATQIYIEGSRKNIYCRRIVSGSWEEWNTGTSNPNYYAFGDSITWGAVWDNDPTTPLYQAPANDTIPARIANAIGAKYYVNGGISGARFVSQGGDSNRIIGTIIKRTNLSAYNIVTIGGGRNDSASPLGNGDTATANDGTICGAFVDILTYLTTTYPKLQIAVYGVTPQPTSTSHEPEDIYTRVFSGGWSLNTYYQEVRKVCARFGVPFIDWYDCTLILRWGVLSGGYSNGTQNWSHALSSDIYKQMGNYLGGKVASIYTG